MAFTCFGIRLNPCPCVFSDSPSNIYYENCYGRNVVAQVGCVGLLEGPNVRHCLILKETNAPVSLMMRHYVTENKGRSGFEVRSHWRSSVTANCNDGETVPVMLEDSNVPFEMGGSISGSNINPAILDCGGKGGADSSHGTGGNGKFPPGNGGGGGDGGDDDEGEDEEEDEFGPILKFDEVIKEVEAHGTTLPSDMLHAAKTVGIRKVLLDRYLELQASAWPLGAAIKSFSLLRNRMLADPSFLFKVGTEIIIDSCCATLAEVQKRGKDFWAEFELYTADLLVGVVVNVALVGMLAPYARFNQPSASKGLLGWMKHTDSALPSSVFEAERPGCSFSIQQRIGTYFFKGFLYGTVGFACGLIGQGIANMIMTAKRSVRKSEEDVPVPPLMKSATLWGVFLAVSSNTRYQIINGLERLVEASPVARRIPPVAMVFTISVRFSNNIYGGMQFVDWARWSGVQ